ncbi:MAG: VWA domain-containing protein [Chloroflexi bacterium]|nr:VWA domain-containing protein [Chloroflexota bacterium]
MRAGKTWFLILTLVALLVATSPVAAQGFDPESPLFSREWPVGGPIRIELSSIDAVIDGPMATVHVTQVFRNIADWQVEGTYIFPLPADAAIGDFQMTVDGEVLEGKVLDADEARAVYQSIVRQRRDPALLEYLGQGLFQTSVFPIPPRAERKIELTYTQLLSLENGLYHFRFPLQTRQYSAAEVGSLAIRVELRNQPGLRTIYSPSHDVAIDRLGDDAAIVGYEMENVRPEKAFELYFGASDETIGLNLISYKPAGEDGFFLLLAAPGIEVKADDVVRRDVILVLDVSGSMKGEKIGQALRAARFVVDNLNPGDRFNLIAFSSAVRLWAKTMKPSDAASRADAHEWINGLRAGGGTDINRALLEALALLQRSPDPTRPAYILFLTDGLPTGGETNSQRIIANALNNRPSERTARLFAFGVGYDVDAQLLDELSRALGGRSSYVEPGERIDEAVGDFYAQISTPVLSDINITFDNIQVEETYPYPLPDLFAGEQLVMVGRYRVGGATAVTLAGQVNGREQVFEFENQQLIELGGEPSVARLWATRKIAALVEQVRRQGSDPELLDEITQLSLDYGIVTPYTSFLVLEPNLAQDMRQPMPPAVERPAAQPGAVVQVEATVVVEKVVEMEVSGREAVAESEVRQQLYEAERALDYEGVRHAAGKSFIFQGYVNTADGQVLELWVDAAYRADMTPQIVVFGSDAYFALAEQPGIAQWLAISPELMLIIKGTAYRITTDPALAENPPRPGSTPATPTPNPVSAPDASSTPSTSLWQALLEWLNRLFGRGTE